MAGLQKTLVLELVSKYAEGLFQAGCSAHRLEESVTRVAHAYGHELDVLALPSGVLLSLDGGDVTRLLRRAPGRYDTSRQNALFTFAETINLEVPSAIEGLKQLGQILEQPPPYSTRVRILNSALAGAVFAVYLEGGWSEVLLGGAVGLSCGLTLAAAQYNHRLERMPELLASVLGAAVAGMLGLFFPSCVVIAVMAGLLLILPGMAFTIGVAEMANRNFLTGSVRLATTAWILVAMTFGAALGSAVPELFGQVPEIQPTTLGLTAMVLCLPLVGTALSVHIQAPVREIPWVIASCAVALGSSRASRLIVEQEWLWSFIAAFAVGIFGNFCTRYRRLPSAALTLAALYLLVPGSVGYRGLLAMVSGDTQKGLDMGLTMALRGAALVAGLVFASLVLPPSAPSSRRQGAARQLWHSERL